MSSDLLSEPVRQPLQLPTSSLFQGASEVVSQIQEAGYKGYLVGGSIRDLVMGKVVADCDIATSASPQTIQSIFPKTVPVGIEFGTVMVLWKGHEYEVTTYRADGRYEDGRRPSSVSFSKHITDDLSRRDLTINGLIYDPLTQEVVDYTGGLQDIQEGMIRTIGIPEDRFGEDRLRMLRAVRFAARLGFQFEEKTLRAIRDLGHHVIEVSAERIHQELLKMLKSHPHASTSWLAQTGLFSVLLPEATESSSVIARQQALEAMGPWSLPVALAVFFSTVPVAQQEATLKRYKFSNEQLKSTHAILAQQDELRSFADKSVADQKRFLRQTYASDILHLGQLLAGLGELPPEAAQEASHKAATWTIDDLSPPRLLTGNDLKQMGIPAGPRFKDVLLALETAQLNEQVTTREEAEAWLDETFPTLRPAATEAQTT